MKASTLKGRSRNKTPNREKGVPLHARLEITKEKFPLKNINSDMTIRELKGYVEFAAGIPRHLQIVHYLDEGDLLDHTDVKSNDIVAGATLNVKVWHTWETIVEAAATNDIDWVFSLGVTQDTDYRTPSSEYMSRKAREGWISERAFVSLFIAAHRGHLRLCEKLINSGADVNAKTSLGRTPLHCAASKGHGKVVDLLLEKGADIDITDVNGHKAQDIAALFGQREAENSLITFRWEERIGMLKKCADINQHDADGKNAISIAAEFGHKDTERHLFLFQWVERAKKIKPIKEPPLMAHQYNDSAFPVWLKGDHAQVYYSQILPAGEFQGSALHSPKTKPRVRPYSAADSLLTRDSPGLPLIDGGQTQGDFDEFDEETKNIYRQKRNGRNSRIGGNHDELSVIAEDERRGRLLSGSQRGRGGRSSVSFEEWLRQKTLSEQASQEEGRRKRAADKAKEAMKRQNDDVRAESYDTWLKEQRQKELKSRERLSPREKIDNMIRRKSLVDTQNSIKEIEGVLAKYNLGDRFLLTKTPGSESKTSSLY